MKLENTKHSNLIYSAHEYIHTHTHTNININAFTFFVFKKEFSWITFSDKLFQRLKYAQPNSIHSLFCALHLIDYYAFTKLPEIAKMNPSMDSLSYFLKW